MRRLALTTIALGAGGATTLLFNVTLARAQGRDSFGETARTLAFAMAVAQLTMASVAPALAREVAGAGSDEARRARAASAVNIGFVLMIVVSAGYGIGLLAHAVPGPAAYVIFGWGVALIYPFYFLLKVVLFALDDVVPYAIAELSADVIFVLVLAVAIVTSPSLGLASFVVAYGAFCLAVALRLKRSATPALPLRLTRPIMRYAAGSFVATYSSVSVFPIMIALAGGLSGRATAGELAAGLALVAPIYLVPQAASTLTFATVARSLGVSHAATVQKSIRTIGTASAVSALLAVMLLRPAVKLVLGSEYAQVVTGLSIVLVCMIPQLVAMPVASAFAAEGAIGLKAAISLASLSLGIGVATFALPEWHALGGYVSVAAAVLSSGLLSIGLTRRRFGVQWRDLVGPSLVLLGAVAAVGVAAVEPLVPLLTCGALAVGVAIVGSRRLAMRMLGYTNRLRPETLWVFVGVVVLSVATAVGVVARPSAIAASVATVVAAVLLPRLRPTAALAALLFYLPFEGIVLTHIPDHYVPWVRYAPEALLLGAAFVLAMSRLALFAAILRDPIIWGLGIVLALGLSAAVINESGTTQALIGLRSEFRFLPALFVVLSSELRESAARLWARVILAAGGVEALIACAELFGGASVRGAFVQTWAVSLGGVNYATAASPTEGVFGTLSNHNELGIFVLMAWTVLAAAGSSRLGLPKHLGFLLGSLFVFVILASGSRESAIGLAAAALAIGIIRFRLPLLRIALAAAILAILFVPALTAPRAAPTSARSYTALSKRWESLLSPATWAAQYHSNFRLFLLASEAHLTVAEAPILGFGPGSVTDRRQLTMGTSPILKTFAGKRAVALDYVYDGNWGLVLVEAGFAGAAALAAVFLGVITRGFRAGRHSWIALATATIGLEVVALGFFAPILQLRSSGLVLWVLVGAFIAERRRSAPTVAPQ